MNTIYNNYLRANYTNVPDHFYLLFDVLRGSPGYNIICLFKLKSEFERSLCSNPLPCSFVFLLIVLFSIRHFIKNSF